MHVKKKVDITYQCNVNLGRFLSTRAFKLLDLLTCWADRKEILTSVTKYPYVSPLPEAPSTLECYWYVDVSSGTETRSGLPSRALCLQRTLLIHFPFLSPFFFPTAYVYVCPADYRKRRYAVVYLLYPVATVEKYEGHVWVPSCLNIPLLSSLTISLSFLSLAATHQHPRCYEQVVYWEGGRHLLIPILETLPPRYRSIIVHPSSSFSLLESLSPFFVCLYITGLISILL